MAREVNDKQPFQDKVVKLIPTEIVGAYLVILGIVAPSQTQPTSDINKYTLIGAFFFLLALTPIYLWKVSGVSNIVQLILSTVSFVVWVYTLVYPFQYWNWYYATPGAVVLVLWSLVTPFFVPETKMEEENPTKPNPNPDPAPQPPV